MSFALTRYVTVVGFDTMADSLPLKPGSGVSHQGDRKRGRREERVSVTSSAVVCDVSAPSYGSPTAFSYMKGAHRGNVQMKGSLIAEERGARGDRDISVARGSLSL